MVSRCHQLTAGENTTLGDTRIARTERHRTTGVVGNLFAPETESRRHCAESPVWGVDGPARRV